MTERNDRTSLLGSRGGQGAQGSVPSASTTSYHDQPSEYGPIYQDESPQKRIFQLSFMIIVVVLALISLILSIYRSASMKNGLYVMMGLSLVGLLVIHVLLIKFIRDRDISTSRTWFLYFVGVAIAVESIFTNVLLFAQG